MADQAGPDGSHQDSQHSNSAATVSNENFRVLAITFVGSLAAILAAGIMGGLAVAFIRLFHKIPGDDQFPAGLTLVLATLGVVSGVVYLARVGRLSMLWRQGPYDENPGARWGFWDMTSVIAMLAVGFIGVLFLVGLAAGLH